MKNLIKILAGVLVIVSNNLALAQLGPIGKPLYMDGSIYMQFRQSSSVVILNKDTILNDASGNILSLFAKYQVTKTETPFAILNTPSLNKTYQISFSNINKADSFVTELNQITSDIEYAEKVPAAYTFSVPNDPLATTSSTVLYHLPLLNANQASNIHISTGNAIVAIIDDAVLIGHEDLAANTGTLNRDVADNDSDVNPPISNLANFTHGTHVAGIAGAVTNNSIGIASIGWNNKLMCVKAAKNSSSGGLFNPMQGVAWAATNGAHVINMSWGELAFSQTHYLVITAAKNNDIVLVAAAGNHLSNIPTYPAAYGEGTTGQPWEIIDKRLVIAVAALDRNNDMMVVTTQSNNLTFISGTNYGNWVDISAYGKDIMSTLAIYTQTGSTTTYQYGLSSGTSMAAPMVAGIAGVMRSYNMSKSANDIIDCLIYTANTDIYGSNHPTNSTGQLGSGRVDAAAALRCISTTCTVNPIAIIIPSSPSLCANTTLTLTTNQSANTYTWSTGATTSSIVVSTPSVYNVVTSYSGGCSTTASINLSQPTLSLSVQTNTSICAGSSINIVSAAGTFTSIVWQPSGLTTSSIVSNSVGNAIYTVTANSSCGGVTSTISVTGVSGIPPFGLNSVYAVLSSTLGAIYSGNPSSSNGRFIVINDATVTGATYLNYSDIIVAANSKITVPSSSTLNIYGSYLHSCGSSMWKGIEIENSGVLNSNIFNTNPTALTALSPVIEDAIAAISSTYNPSTGLVPEINIANSILNKNFIDISLTGYNLSASQLNKIIINNSVFSCRDFSLNPNNTNFIAPSTYTSSQPGVGVNNSLRYTTQTDLDGIAPPFMQGYASTTLKAPYSSQTSNTAIKLISVGITTNNVFHSISIGDDTDAGNFNLFDSHHKFIDATNSNVVLRNNVFQNCSGPAVESVFTATTSMKGVLDLSPSSATVTNRFWDCRQAISGNRVYKFNMRHAIVRSTQNATNTANSALCFGVNMKTGNFDYIISQNEFTNIYDGINISVIPVTVSSGTFNLSYIDAHDLIITSNTFSAVNVSGSFSNRAINVSSLFNIPWTNAPACNYTYTAHSGNISNHCRGLTIDGNHINGAFRGIAVNGVSNFQTNIQGNIISLRDDNVFNVAQQGIYLVNSMSGANKPSQFQIAQNSVSGGTASVSNPLMSMVFSGNNMGIYSPSISCNEIQDSHKGFVFNGANSNAVWAGNIMQPMAQGLRLENAAVIGTQGGPSLVNANQWQGTWTGDHTYVDGAATNATNSVLWVKFITGYIPTINNGPFPSQYYGTSNNSVRNGSVAADFNCIGIPNALVIPVPHVNEFNDDSQGEYYIQKTALYRFLHFNDSLRLADEGGELATFYGDMAETSIDKFMQVEELLYEGNYAEAQDMLALIEPSDQHPVENNYKGFYTLCANYLTLDEDQQYSEADSLALHDLAILCPGTNGACIYQARALYNTIFGQELNYEACGEASGNRAANNTSIENIVETSGLDGVKIFPNPATNKLNIIGKNETDLLYIEIFDVSGRSVFQKTAPTKNKSFDLDFDLLNGIYFLTIKDSQNNTLNEKLIIAK